jgi:hypothetical protein
MSPVVAQLPQALGDLVGGIHQHLGELLRLVHRRLDAVQPELVGRLLGVVDDVVEGARQRMDVGRVEVAVAAAALGEPAEDLVGDAVALVLAVEHLAGELRPIGVLGEQVPQQARGVPDVAAGLLEQREELGLLLRPRRRHGGTVTGPPGPQQVVHSPFTSASRLGNRIPPALPDRPARCSPER